MNKNCTNLIPELEYPENKLCFAPMIGGPDVCHGDSGSPLICDGKLTGIVSQHDQQNNISIFINLYNYKSYIKENFTRKSNISGSVSSFPSLTLIMFILFCVPIICSYINKTIVYF